MWYQNLFDELEKLKNEELAVSMAKYMKDKFIFLGIPRPALKKFASSYLKESKKYDLDLDFVRLCWQNDYREAQYIGIMYLERNIDKLDSSHIDFLKQLIITKSWWETTDSLDSIVGNLVLKDKTLENTMLEWSTIDNIWLRRVSIDFQRNFKDNTNTELFEKILVNNLGTDEFFINKALGWSLREYSKTHPCFVRDIIDRYHDKLSKLTIREGSKYI